VAVLPGAEIDLGHPFQAHLLVDIDHHADLHAVPGEERHPPHQLTAPGELAAQRLHEAGQFRIEEVDQGLGHELGDAPAPVRGGLAALREWPTEPALAELDPRIRQQRAERAGDEVLLEVLRVGVGEHDDVPPGHGQGAPHGIALTLSGPVSGHKLVFRIDLGAMGAGYIRGAVWRIRVDDDDLIR
jgi:hypothetical protein